MTGTVLNTGESRGIGAATARLAARRGYAVAINYRTEAGRAEALVHEIRGEGGQAVAVRADVAQQDQVTRLLQEVDERLDREPVARVADEDAMSCMLRPRRRRTGLRPLTESRRWLGSRQCC
jgi:NAD(P)-dependent dehydrogenase (short-subunit alcohol dehydrogenase family)